MGKKTFVEKYQASLPIEQDLYTIKEEIKEEKAAKRTFSGLAPDGKSPTGVMSQRSRFLQERGVDVAKRVTKTEQTGCCVIL